MRIRKRAYACIFLINKNCIAYTVQCCKFKTEIDRTHETISFITDNTFIVQD